MHPPSRPLPSVDLVRALIGHYETERRVDPEQPVEVAFFHGGLPCKALLGATEHRAVRIACLPGDLEPALLENLLQHRVETIEIDVGTHQTAHRRSVGRRRSSSALAALVRGLRDRGVRVGVVLTPGLPGTGHADALADAAWVAELAAVDFVRLQPALAWESTLSAQWVADGRWTPMTIAEAITTVEGMMDLLDASGVDVARVGLQPGADLAGTVSAGPVHPNLRSLVEYRRFRRRMRSVLALVPRRRAVELRVHPADLSWAKGQGNANIRSLRAELRLTGLSVRPDGDVARGAVVLGGKGSDPFR